MNKKIIVILFTLFLLLIGVKSINAAECNYTYKGKAIKLITSDGEGENSKIYDELKVEPDWPNEYQERNSIMGASATPMEVKGVHVFIDTSQLENTKMCYGSIQICSYKDGNSIYYGLFGSALDPSTVDSPYAAEYNKDNLNWLDKLIDNRLECTQAELNGDQRNVLAAQGNLLYQIIEKYYERYTNCSNNSSGNKGKAEAAKCRGEELSNAEKYTNMLKSTCSSIVQNTAINSSDGCVQSCLKATKELADLQEKYIGSTNVNGETCSLSGRLVIWISNIIKWVKYIVPVIVIVLGILDFIKAIGADKDDEMKKAQGKFVKRLIAAALVFIIPFILQFVLEKLGFAANGCGIIDL